MTVTIMRYRRSNETDGGGKSSCRERFRNILTSTGQVSVSEPMAEDL